ncbi:hypothetical protein [Bacillus sp. JJ722]|uniref:hypothetical protein n=1 Tax=Bacillus sp. JJ722 TaxID=3122973 RepID=UPI003000F96C
MDVEDLISRAAEMFFDEHVDRKKGLEDLTVSYYRRHEEETLKMLEEEGMEEAIN